MADADGEVPPLPWTYPEQRVIIGLAGDIAARRALRPDGQGWCRLLSEDQLTCFHESGHAAVASALGWHCFQINMDPGPEKTERGNVRAYVSLGPTADPIDSYVVCLYAWAIGRQYRASRDKPLPEIFSDRRNAALICLSIGGNWKAALKSLHVLRAASHDLVEQNWKAVRWLTEELQLRRRIDAARIASILERAVDTR